MVRILLKRFNGAGGQPVYEPLEIDNPVDGRELIRALVRSTLATWSSDSGLGGVKTLDDASVAERGFSGPLAKSEIQAKADAGGIKFGRRHSLGLPNESEAAEAAEAAFSNGLVRIFINDDEVKSLEAKLALRDDDKVCLIALSGLRSGFRW